MMSVYLRIEIYKYIILNKIIILMNCTYSFNLTLKLYGIGIINEIK